MGSSSPNRDDNKKCLSCHHRSSLTQKMFQNMFGADEFSTTEIRRKAWLCPLGLNYDLYLVEG